MATVPLRPTSDDSALIPEAGDPYYPMDEAVARFRAALIEIREMPGQTDGKDPVADRRWEAILALLATINFLRSLPGLDGLETPLHGLATALYDATNGVHNPLLEPVKRSGNRDSFEGEAFHAQAAVAMELYRRAGLQNDEAARRVAQALRSRGVTASQVNYWRECAKGRVDSERYIVRGYRDLLERITAQAEGVPEIEAMADELLANLLD